MIRVIQESSVMAPHDSDIAGAQQERQKTNKLSHRTKYRRGLADYVIDYQFSIQKYNEDIHKILDGLSSYAEDDPKWKKMLTEMDGRKYRIGEYDEKLKGH